MDSYNRRIRIPYFISWLICVILGFAIIIFPPFLISYLSLWWLFAYPVLFFISFSLCCLGYYGMRGEY